MWRLQPGPALSPQSPRLPAQAPGGLCPLPPAGSGTTPVTPVSPEALTRHLGTTHLVFLPQTENATPQFRGKHRPGAQSWGKGGCGPRTQAFLALPGAPLGMEAPRWGGAELWIPPGTQQSQSALPADPRLAIPRGPEPALLSVGSSPGAASWHAHFPGCWPYCASGLCWGRGFAPRLTGASDTHTNKSLFCDFCLMRVCPRHRMSAEKRVSDQLWGLMASQRRGFLSRVLKA